MTNIATSKIEVTDKNEVVYDGHFAGRLTKAGSRWQVKPAVGAQGDMPKLKGKDRAASALVKLWVEAGGLEAVTKKVRPSTVDSPSARKIANALNKLPGPRVRELYEEAFGEPPARNAAATKVRSRLGKHLEGKKLPADVAEKIYRPRQRSESSGPSKIDVMVELLRRKNGASVNEIAERLLEQFPNLSARNGGGPAKIENYINFARVCLSHLNAGRVFSASKELKGKIERFGERGSSRYRIVD